MHLSLSEIEATLVKAVLGVGLPLGLGEEAGRAAQGLASKGVDGLSAYADALDAVDIGDAVGFPIEAALDGVFSPAEGGRALSAFQAGPSACDLLVASARNDKGTVSVSLSKVDAPLVLLGQALLASAQIDVAIAARWRGFEGLCQGGNLRMSGGGLDDFCAAGPVEMTLVLQESVPPLPVMRSDAETNGLSADENIWRRIYSYADRQLVPATETSRLTGAGAGLTDND